ncbi:MAG: acyl-CoA dehydratase activase [Thermodesulfobacteriota bacterium]
MKTVGIDVGSITAKAAVWADGRILSAKVGLTGYNAGEAGRRIFDEVLAGLGLTPKDVDRVVSTGYGRNSVAFADKAMTEILCHGAGAWFLRPGVRSLVDIGGQDSKAIVLGPDGKVKDFAMNDKCAAGTGRFLEVMAHALGLPVGELGPMSEKAADPARISSICTVFAESEVISLISKGEKRENIIAGIHDSIAARVSALSKRLGVRAPVLMTGGVAKNRGVVRALEKKLGVSLEVLETAQVNGAIGAAILAAGL